MCTSHFCQEENASALESNCMGINDKPPEKRTCYKEESLVIGTNSDIVILREIARDSSLAVASQISPTLHVALKKGSN